MRNDFGTRPYKPRFPYSREKKASGGRSQGYNDRLDDISPLSKNRKIVYIGVIVLAILCAPLPQSIFP